MTRLGRFSLLIRRVPRHRMDRMNPGESIETTRFPRGLGSSHASGLVKRECGKKYDTEKTITKKIDGNSVEACSETRAPQRHQLARRTAGAVAKLRHPFDN